MKACIKCGVMKPLDQFHRHAGGRDGHLNACMSCKTRSVRANYAAKREHYLAYAARYNRMPGVSARREAAKLKVPMKIKARNALAYAVRSGKLVRQPCEVCWAEPAQGHHRDYSKPLDVKWLCPKHHGEEHVRS